MDANELGRVELFLDVPQGLPDEVGGGPDVDVHVDAAGLDPIDFGRVEEDELAPRANHEGAWSGVGGWGALDFAVEEGEELVAVRSNLRADHSLVRPVHGGPQAAERDRGRETVDGAMGVGPESIARLCRRHDDGRRGLAVEPREHGLAAVGREGGVYDEEVSGVGSERPRDPERGVAGLGDNDPRSCVEKVEEVAAGGGAAGGDEKRKEGPSGQGEVAWGR